jgi:hypothetical protein
LGGVPARLQYGSQLGDSLAKYKLPLAKSQALLARNFSVARKATGRSPDKEVIDIAAGYIANWYFHLDSRPIPERSIVKSWLVDRLPQLKPSAEAMALASHFGLTDPPKPVEIDASASGSDPIVAHCVLRSYSSFRFSSESDAMSADALLKVIRSSGANPGVVLYAESGVLMEKYFFRKKLSLLEEAIDKLEMATKMDKRVDQVKFSKKTIDFWKKVIEKKKSKS